MALSTSTFSLAKAALLYFTSEALAFVWANSMSLIAFINLLDGEARILYTSCFVWFLTTVLLNGTRSRVSTSPLPLEFALASASSLKDQTNLCNLPMGPGQGNQSWFYSLSLPQAVLAGHLLDQLSAHTFYWPFSSFSLVLAWSPQFVGNHAKNPSVHHAWIAVTKKSSRRIVLQPTTKGELWGYRRRKFVSPYRQAGSTKFSISDNKMIYKGSY